MSDEDDPNEDDPVRRHRRFVGRAFSHGPQPYYGHNHGKALFCVWVGSWLVFWIGLFWLAGGGGDLAFAVMAGVIMWLLIGLLLIPLSWYELVGTDRRERDEV